MKVYVVLRTNMDGPGASIKGVYANEAVAESEAERLTAFSADYYEVEECEVIC